MDIPAPLLTGMQPPARPLYAGSGRQIREELVRPALSCAVSYDRLTGYFSTEVLVAVADELENVWRRGGQVRLVLGLHDIPEDIARVHARDEFDEATIAHVRSRLVSETTSLSDEFRINRLATLAWMIRDGLLAVKAAVPVSDGGAAQGGIFHAKRSIFVDAEGNSLVATGSPNETIPGQGANFEEVTAFASWVAGLKPYTDDLRSSFERIWTDSQHGLAVVDVTPEMGRELENALNLDFAYDAQGQSTGRILDVLANSPFYAPHNLGPAALYPHQERAWIDGLSRWPIRVVLADEVGLGKTLECGAIVAWYLRMEPGHSVTILAPKSVLKQWQDEMEGHFGLPFWLYDSARKAFVSPDGDEVQGRPGDRDMPELQLVSAQYARGNRTSGHVFQAADVVPDMLVVDEAHAARLRIEDDGGRRPTLLWRMLDDLTSKIEHLVLMTATPVQMNPLEFHGLLDLLGLPHPWADSAAYGRSLEILANGEKVPALDDANWAVKLLLGSAEGFGWTPGSGAGDVPALMEALSEEGESPSSAANARKNWVAAYEAMVASHPGNLLTVRNTRTVLARLGYKFPDRQLVAPILEVPSDVTAFYQAVEEYLQDSYGKTEEALEPGLRRSLGFAKSSYYQRLASTLYAAGKSLERRRKKVLGMAAGVACPSEGDAELEADEGLLEISVDVAAAANARAVQRESSIEAQHIEGLLGILDGMGIGSGATDPKMEAMLARVHAARQAGDAILVFSRYTDTIAQAVDAYERSIPTDVEPRHAQYTGGDVWVTRGGVKVPANKEQVRAALEDGEVGVVFCSDAASEGLNLQAARVLINIDVPWNPARLEQRIGRIARLGQKADTVEIVNLWYPGSVEARMYRRLIERKEYYELAVGECPELISESIRGEVSGRIGGDSTQQVDPFKVLQEHRKSLQVEALGRVWGLAGERSAGSKELMDGLALCLADAAQSLGWQVTEGENLFHFEDVERGNTYRLTAEPGTRYSLTWRHPVVRAVLSRLSLPRRLSEHLRVVRLGDRVSCIAKIEDGRIEVIGPEGMPSLLMAVLEDGELPTGELVKSSGTGLQSAHLKSAMAAASRWWPDLEKIRTGGNRRDEQPLQPTCLGGDVSVESATAAT